MSGRGYYTIPGPPVEPDDRWCEGVADRVFDKHAALVSAAGLLVVYGFAAEAAAVTRILVGYIREEDEAAVEDCIALAEEAAEDWSTR